MPTQNPNVIESESSSVPEAPAPTRLELVGARLRTIRREIAAVLGIRPKRDISQVLLAEHVSTFCGFNFGSGQITRLENGESLPSNLGLYQFLAYHGYSLEYLVFGRAPQKLELTALPTQQLFAELSPETQIDLAVEGLFELALRKENPYKFLNDFAIQLLRMPLSSPCEMPALCDIDARKVDVFS